MIALDPEPLEPAAFAPFGAVLAFDPAKGRLVNEGTAHRADTGALFDHAPATFPVLAIYRAEARTMPIRLSLFERHPNSSQSFIALSVRRFLVVVAHAGPDGLPAMATLRAFVGRDGTGVSYRRNQWHMPIMALRDGGDLLMLMAESGEPDDCIEHRLAAPLLLRSAQPDLFESTTHGA